MTISLHVRHEVTPERTFAVLQALENGETIDHITQYERQLTRLRQLGLVEQDSVTVLGNRVLGLCHMKPDLWGDLTHYLHYTLWDGDHESAPGYSWTYRQFTNAAWDLNHFELTTELKETIVSSLINQADEAAELDNEAFKKGVVSLSRDSLSGVITWLKSLIPPVIDGDQFSRRGFCQTELLLLATGHIAQKTGAEIGVDMLLTPQRRDAICRLCILEPAALDRTLDWMLPAYANIVQPGTTGGTYGRFLRFLQWPTMADLSSR